MWLMLPVMCVITALLCILLIPVAIVFGITFTVKPGWSNKMTSTVQRAVIRQVMGRAMRQPR
jgi:hypothetical protein